MAKKTPAIKTDLFRFVTFRSPEELTYQDKKIRFVLHPDLTASVIKSCPVPPRGVEDLAEFNEYLTTFPSYATKEDVRAVNAALFDYANAAYKRKEQIANIRIVPEGEVSTLSADNELRLFDALFGEVVSKKSSSVRQAISKMLIVNHALRHSERLVDMGLKKLTDIKIEIPHEVLECYKPWLFNECGGSLEGVQNLGVADFRRVEQEVCCYVPGEVSHIENVMAKEYKERSTRNFVRTEDTFETETETTIENLTDVTTATRNELSTEVANVLEKDRSSAYGGSLGVSAKYLGAEIDVNAYADFTTSNSSSYSNTEAKTYAEEVTKRALERIVQKTSQKRTSKIIKEFEENNKHGFDNRSGDVHVTGIYRWIDIIYKNRLVNYGKRLMVEFMVPEPAEFYKTILKYKKADSSTPSTDDGPTPPKSLTDFGIAKSSDITSENVMNIASYYGVNILPLPPSSKNISLNLSPNQPVDHNRNINNQNLGSVTIDPEYEATKITGSYTYEYRANSWGSPQQAFCDFTFGGVIVSSGGNYSGDKENKTVTINKTFSPVQTGTMPISVAYSGCFGFYGAATLQCSLKASYISEWQNDAYNKFVASYNQKLEAHNQAIKENEAQDVFEAQESVGSTNPAMNRIIEQRELKRICIEMLMKPYCKTQGKDNNTDINACDLYQIPQVNQTKAFSKYASTVKFFEQAIDWELMSYLFYPYYWADKCDWADLIQSNSEDLVFQAFLQSGMGRVVVPIRQQFTQAFAYYIETGEIWLGNDLVAGTQSDLYLSIAEEMQTVEGAVEEEWETRVPTSLAIIQGRSAFLGEEGLPCCQHIENDDSTSNISGTGDTLQIITP